MKLFLVLAGLSVSLASMYGRAAFLTRELDASMARFRESGWIMCTQVTLPDSLPVGGDHYIDNKTFLRLSNELAPVISDTTKLPGHPRRALQVRSARVPIPDYAAWWPRAGDSVALFWRFGLSRGVYVAAALNGDGDLIGHVFLTVGARREGPIAFRSKRVACITPPVA